MLTKLAYCLYCSIRVSRKNKKGIRLYFLLPLPALYELADDFSDLVRITGLFGFKKCKVVVKLSEALETLLYQLIFQSGRYELVSVDAESAKKQDEKVCVRIGLR